jgi:hypothetical protein
VKSTKLKTKECLGHVIALGTLLMLPAHLKTFVYNKNILKPKGKISMENELIYMIVGTALFVLATIVLAIYSWKLSKQFPNLVKAKITRIETTPDDKYQYHFECKSGGRRIMKDVTTYKKKEFKVGEKITVRMSAKGNTCHSNFPIWPIVTSSVCLIIAIMIPLVFFAEKRSDEIAEKAENSLYQETGYYVVTDSATFLFGDNLGLTKLNTSENHISTGDYGSVFFIGTPKYEEGSLIPMITSLGSNVSEDGTVDNLPDGIIEQMKNLGYTINYDVTDSVSIIESENSAVKDEESHEGHDHD